MLRSVGCRDDVEKRNHCVVEAEETGTVTDHQVEVSDVSGRSLSRAGDRVSETRLPTVMVGVER